MWECVARLCWSGKLCPAATFVHTWVQALHLCQFPRGDARHVDCWSPNIMVFSPRMQTADGLMNSVKHVGRTNSQFICRQTDQGQTTYWAVKTAMQVSLVIVYLGNCIVHTALVSYCTYSVSVVLYIQRECRIVHTAWVSYCTYSVSVVLHIQR
jgi:hypothetical protein